MKPDQRVLSSERTPEWYKENLLYYSRRCQLATASRTRTLYLLGLATGKLKETEYKYLLNPTNDKQKKNYPAKLQNFDIVSPIIRQLLGEHISRPFDPLVYAINSDVSNQRQKALVDGIINSLHQKFVNTMIQMGQFVEGQTDENGQPIQEPQHPDEIKKAAMNIPDMKSIMGQRILNFVRLEQDLDAHFRRAWYHFVVTNRCVTFRAVDKDNIKYFVCNPINFDYYGNTSERFIENMESQRYTSYVTYAELVDLFGEDEDAEEMLSSLQRQETGENVLGFFDHFARNFQGEAPIDGSHDGTHTLEHIQWTGLAKEGILVINGEKIRVDEDYKPLPTEDVQWIWVSQKYEGYIVNGKYFLGGRALELQRGDMTNPNKCKSNYGGLVLNFADGLIQQSLIEQLEVYQHTYNASKWKLQTFINRLRGKWTVIPKGLVTFEEDENWDLDKAIDLADALGTLFIDETIENIQTIVQAIKDVDPGNGAQIEQVIRHCEQIKMEAEELVGFNRYRKAQTTASDPVSNMQQGQYIGSLITEIFFKEFEDFKQKECQAILDYSKIAYVDGKQAMYMRSDGEIEEMLVTPEDLVDTEYGLFIANGGEQRQAIQMLQNQVQALVQNGLGGATLGKILKPGKNFDQMQEALEQGEKEMLDREQQKQQSEQQIQRDQMAQAQQQHAENMQLEYYKIDAPIEADLNKALIEAQGDDGNVNADKLIFEVQKALADIHLRRQQMQVDLQKSILKAETDKYKADKSVTVARTNPG